MAIQQSFIPCNETTWVDFSQLKVIGQALTAFGWAQTSDTGQANWNTYTIAISGCTKSGSNVTYSYTGTVTGSLLNQFITVTGMTNAANNVVQGLITAVGTGTFTIANGSGVTETGSSGSGTNATPTGTPNLYEIWHPTDTLQTGATQFFLKLSYGLFTSASIFISYQLGTGTNGTGTLTGVTTAVTTSFAGNIPTQTFECNFSGASNRFQMYLWRTNQQNYVVTLSVERLKDATGADTANGVVMIGAGVVQTVISFVANAVFQENALTVLISSQQSLNYNSQVAVSPVYPYYAGLFGNPLLGVITAVVVDVAEGEQASVTLYGVAHNYLVCKVAKASGMVLNSNGAILLRYE